MEKPEDFITPEYKIKRAIEHPLEMTSLIARGKPMQDLVNEQYENVFTRENRYSLRLIVNELFEDDD